MDHERTANSHSVLAEKDDLGTNRAGSCWPYFSYVCKGFPVQRMILARAITAIQRFKKCVGHPARFQRPGRFDLERLCDAYHSQNHDWIYRLIRLLPGDTLPVLERARVCPAQ
jgi:hypothetical protein